MTELKSNESLQSDINQLNDLQDLDVRSRRELSKKINSRKKRLAELERRLLNNVQYEIS